MLLNNWIVCAFRVNMYIEKQTKPRRETKMTRKFTKEEKALFTEIANETMGFETLESKDSGEDWREVSVRGIEAALERAYRAGQACTQK